MTQKNSIVAVELSVDVVRSLAKATSALSELASAHIQACDDSRPRARRRGLSRG